MDIYEILAAFEPAFAVANRTDETGKFLRPDYREALMFVWEDILVAYGVKMSSQPPVPSLNLNVALAQRVRAQKN